MNDDDRLARFSALLEMLWFSGQLNPDDPDFDYQSAEAVAHAHMLPSDMLTEQDRADVRTLRAMRDDYGLS